MSSPSVVAAPPKRKPGRPRTYVFDKPDALLTENEQKQKIAVEKRRTRQNRSYQRKKAIRMAAQETQRIKELNQQHLEVLRLQGLVPQQQIDGNGRPYGVDLHPVPQGVFVNGVDLSQGINMNAPPEISQQLQQQLQQLQLQQQHQQLHQQQSQPLPQQNMQHFPQGQLSNWSPRSISPLSPPTGAGLVQNAQQNGEMTVSTGDAKGNGPLSPFSMEQDGKRRSPSSISASSTITSIGFDSSDMVVPELAQNSSISASGPFDQNASSVFENANHQVVPTASTDTLISDPDVEQIIDAAAADNYVDGEYMRAEEDAIQQTLDTIEADGIPEDVAMMTMKQTNDASISGILLPVMGSKFASLDFESQAAVLDLVIFPGSFNEAAATAVTERTAIKPILSQLESVSFIERVGYERFQLHPVAKSFLTTSGAPILQSVLSIAMNSDRDALKLRFMRYFTTYLASLEEDENIHMLGPARAKAIQAFDTERDNMSYTQFLSREDSKAALNSFLTAASSVLRFCVSPQERAFCYNDALEIDANSSDAFAVKPELTPDPLTNSLVNDELAEYGLEPDPEPPTDFICPKMKVKATLQLGLAEAFYDMQQLMRVRDPLTQVHQTLGATTQLSCIPEIREKTLSLLLCANLAMTEGRVAEAKASLFGALRCLKDGNLSRSTYGVGALLGLIGVYSANNEHDKAKRVADELLGVLSSLGFENMPLYADCIGCRAAVLLATEDYAGAEEGFSSALGIVKEWLGHTWTQAPMQHCLDLDLWLMEGMKRALMAQGKAREAYAMTAKIKEALATRGVQSREDTPLFDWDRWWLNARHLY